MPADQLRAQLQTALAGRYAIERELGRGGMATVYLARDLKHQRLVALKVLDPELGAVLGGERFLAEIRVTANLQHPNLLPLFDSGAAEGLLFYVMPFVEGESLRARLDRERQLPVDEAVRLATAVAGALDYAHGHGVIHRDLKPENILLQHGQPVVADFGIALAVSNAGGQRVTQTGLSLGTPQYMSPEQATGDRVIDGRTDVYSLGAVCYEMLTGEPPHGGSTAQAVIARLMTERPRPVRVLRDTVPPHVEAAVLRALEKLPADRFASAKGFAEALTTPGATTGVAAAAPGTPLPARAARTIAVLGGSCAVLLAAALWGWLRPAEPTPVRRYAVALDSAEAVIDGPRWGRIALSPDGSVLAYVGGPRNALLVRRRDELNAREIPGTTNAGAPAFSPDGRRIAFIQMARILTIASLDGSPTFAVTDSLIGLPGLSWGADDMIYAVGRDRGTLIRIAARAGAKPERVAALDTAARETDRAYPEALPDGGVLFTTSRGSGASRRASIAVLDPGSESGAGPGAGAGRVLIADAIRARYSPSGHVVYATTDGNLMAVRFDRSSRTVAGDPVLIAQGSSRDLPGIDFAVSRDGTLAYIGGTPSGDERELVWVGRDGRAERVDSTWRAQFTDPVLSPDGKAIAVSTGSAFLGAGVPGDIWVKRLDTGGSFKLSVEGGHNRYPVWTRDGKKILYASAVGDTFAVVEKPADGSAAAVRRLTARESIGHIALTPDEQWLLYTVGTAGATRVWARRAGDTTATLLFPDDPLARYPAVSPDGKWVAYSSLTGGTVPQVYVSPFPNTRSAKWIVSTSGGSEPTWSRRGTELFYRRVVSRSFWSAAVSTSPTFSFAAPRQLFSTADYPASRAATSLDDARFLMVRRIGGVSREQLTIVENWARDLERARTP